MSYTDTTPKTDEFSKFDTMPPARDSSFDDSSSADSIALLERDINNSGDLEKGQPQEPAPAPINHEYTVPLRTKLIALAGYFLCNIGLTIYNKAILGSFRFPWLLTAVHSGCSFLGATGLMYMGHFQASKLTRRENLALVAFSFLFTINIAISNVSLAMVSVPFHQVVRATTPIFTTILFRLCFGRTFSRDTYLSLLPIVFGVFLATYGEMAFSDLGFLLTFLGVLLAALKTIVTNKMMTGSLALSFWEILRRMSPLACAQSIIYAFVTGELGEFSRFARDELWQGKARFSPTVFALVMLGNGALAFALNVSSFSTNKIAGALTMTVCANIKQCITIVLGGLLFGAQMTTTNLWGVLVTLVGGATYSYVELDNKKRRAALQSSSR